MWVTFPLRWSEDKYVNYKGMSYYPTTWYNGLISMRYLLLMINKVRLCRNDRRRYVKTRRHREQTRSWNNFYRIRANIMHKHYMVDHLEEENMFNIRIIDSIRVILITRGSSLPIQAHWPRERCDLHSIRTWFIVLITLLQDLIVMVHVILRFMLDICLKLTKIVQTSTQKLRLRRAHNP